MDAFEKTKAHERVWLSTEWLVENKDNPNKMSPREFDLLVNNIMEKGMTEDIEVREIVPNEEYRIIGGHHRYRACKYLTWLQVPCIINRDPDLTDKKEKVQLVRMNTIHGKLDPEKFVKLYEELQADGHQDDIIQEMLGFAEEKEFRNLIKDTAAALPPELKQQFEAAAKEVKTVEDLAKVLNTLLLDYGDTLEYGYMIFDFEGRESIWVRMLQKQRKDVYALSNWCRENNRALDDVIMHLVNSSSQHYDEILAGTPERDITTPNHVPTTLDNIEGYGDG